MTDQPVEMNACVIVLVGVTADAEKNRAVRKFLQNRFGGRVMVPEIPQRKGLYRCADWLRTHLANNGVPDEFREVHFLNYISGGYLFRLISPVLPPDLIKRVVYVRGPIQERVPGALVRRYTWPLIRLTQGKMVTDLASKRLAQIPQSPLGCDRGLIVETGVSELACSLGLSVGSVPAEDWRPGIMLPGASDVLHVEESHDDVYTSENVLGPVLEFFRTGRFRKGGVPR